MKIDDVKTGAIAEHKQSHCTETIIGTCKTRFVGSWIDCIMSIGIDRSTGNEEISVRSREDFLTNFEIKNN